MHQAVGGEDGTGEADTQVVAAAPLLTSGLHRSNPGSLSIVAMRADNFYCATAMRCHSHGPGQEEMLTA